MEKIGVIGAGAMGSFYASKFYEMDSASAAFIAKGGRYEKLKRNGIVVNGKQYSFRVINPERDSEFLDLIIVAVKHHHLPQAIDDLSNVVGPHTQILSVMNGIDSEESIGA
ncbi:MAG: NAD(P)-binding domain-containing protein, partial [Deltaproteobacteria bacterium]|nr:NAD(P)-binding domain-containing protein [Deltaproteobacteria bacterium]